MIKLTFWDSAYFVVYSCYARSVLLRLEAGISKATGVCWCFPYL